MPYCVSITKAGSPSVLAIQDMPMPVAKVGEVCIEVHFAGINFADTLMRLGLYQPRPAYPFTPGYELSGVIHSLGPEVTGFKVGQRVVAAVPTGAQCSHICVKTSRVIPIPDSMGLDAAAAMPVQIRFSFGCGPRPALAPPAKSNQNPANQPASAPEAIDPS